MVIVFASFFTVLAVVSCLVLSKRQTTEVEKPTAQKGFFSDLKKKGSASALSNIFSGLMASTAPSTSGGASTGGENVDPFLKSYEAYPRKMESTSSSSGVSSKSGDGGTSEISVPPTVAGSGLEEVDQGKSYRGHISLGELACVWIFMLSASIILFVRLFLLRIFKS